MTKDDFYHAAIVSGLVSEDAVHDAENYDGGEVLEQLDAMYAALQVEPECEHKNLIQADVIPPFWYCAKCGAQVNRS
jgi:hypothetical protein